MFEKILLPLDGSEIAEMVLPYGEELASRLGSELILFHVKGQEHQREYEHIHQMYLDRLAETVEHNIRNSQPHGPIKVTTKVEIGDPQENISTMINKEYISLIIMSAVSASGLKVGKTIGSVTDHISRTVAIPVMLIRPQNIQQTEKGKLLINRILGPVDGSDLSKLALPVVEELGTRLKVDIVLFQMAHKIRPYIDPMGNMAYFDYMKIDDDVEKQVRTQMVALEKELRETGINATNVVTSGFDAAEEIIKTVKTVGADLVVMSTHGRSGVKRWVFGNVAEKVLRHGETPLLLVHAQTA
jgi:nucleotide-binding universal stress UspA family protein